MVQFLDLKLCPKINERRVSSMKRIAYLLLLALVLSACSVTPLPVETPVPDHCSPEELTEFITAMDDLAQRFDDLAQVSEDTPAENLRPVIEEMESIRQGVELIDTPSCALRVRAAFENYTFSQTQCIFHTHAVAVIEESQLAEPKIDYCSLASDQFGYYNTQMDELRVLLSE